PALGDVEAMGSAVAEERTPGGRVDDVPGAGAGQGGEVGAVEPLADEFLHDQVRVADGEPSGGQDRLRRPVGIGVEGLVGPSVADDLLGEVGDVVGQAPGGGVPEDGPQGAELGGGQRSARGRVLGGEGDESAGEGGGLGAIDDAQQVEDVGAGEVSAA